MDVCLFKGRDGWRYATSGELGPHGDFFKLMRYNVRIPADLFEAIRMLPKSRGGEQ